jgi:hypothetical protein
MICTATVASQQPAGAAVEQRPARQFFSYFFEHVVDNSVLRLEPKPEPKLTEIEFAGS